MSVDGGKKNSIGSLRPGFDHPLLTQFGQVSAKSGPVSTEFGHTSTNFGMASTKLC